MSHTEKKLSPQDVLAIFSAVAGGTMHRVVGEAFGICKQHVGDIASGRRHANITGADYSKYRETRKTRKEMSTKERLMIRTEIDPSENGCWIWVGGGSTDSYGNKRGYIPMIQPNGRYKATRASRVSYEAYCGPIPVGMSVCHTCDRPACINPSHLFLGTQADNMRDMSLKGRAVLERPWSRGEANGNAALTETQVLEIMAHLSVGARPASIAKQYSVSAPTICRIRDGVTWVHVSAQGG